MSWRAVGWALEQGGLRSADKLLLIVLANRADKSGRCYPSIATLAADSALNKETVIVALRRLEKRGLLTRQKRWGESVIYQLIGIGAPTSIPENQNSEKPAASIPENPPPVFRKSGKKPLIEPVIEPITCADAHVSVACGNATSRRSCLHREIIALYHELLPELRGVLVKRWGGQRAQDLAARWREDDKHQDLAFWRWFFGQVRKDRFYLGENDRSWRADLGFLVQRKNFDKILEAAVSAQRRRAVA